MRTGNIFDSVKTCNHECNPGVSCTMCKVIALSIPEVSEKYSILKESEATRLQLKKLALLSQQLVTWTMKYERRADFECVVDLCLDCSTVSAVRSRESQNFSLQLLQRAVSKLTRVNEVGHFAATFLQCRIRKYLVRRAVLREVTRRFEAIPATATRPITFFDRLTERVWWTLPILSNPDFLPSPRTVQRREHATEKLRAMRYDRFLNSLPVEAVTKNYAKDQMEDIETLLRLALLRDTIQIGVEKLSIFARDQQVGDLGRERLVTIEANGVIDLKDSASISCTWDEATSSSSAAANEMGHCHYVWITLSAPTALPSARKLGETFFLWSQSNVNEDNHTDTLIQQRQPTKSKQSSTAIVPTLLTFDKLTSAGINNRLIFFYKNAWQSLHCDTPDDVLTRLRSPFWDTVIESAVQLKADLDSKHIDRFNVSWEKNLESGKNKSGASLWRSNYDDEIMETAKEVIRTLMSPNSKSASFPLDNDEDNDSADKVSSIPNPKQQLLPLHIELRPLNGDSANEVGHFRLFFLGNVFVAATQMMPWVFYTQVYSNRDSLVRALKIFVASAEVQKLVNQYFASNNSGSSSASITTTISNKKTRGAAAMSAASARGTDSIRKTSSAIRKTATLLSTEKRPDTSRPGHMPFVSQLFIPPPRLIFPNVFPTVDGPQDDDRSSGSSSFGQTQLSYSKASELQTKYSFLRKLSMWRRLMNDYKKKSSKIHNTHSASSSSSSHFLINTITLSTATSKNSDAAMKPSEHSTMSATQPNRVQISVDNLNELASAIIKRQNNGNVNVFDNDNGAILAPKRELLGSAVFPPRRSRSNNDVCDTDIIDKDEKIPAEQAADWNAAFLDVENSKAGLLAALLQQCDSYENKLQLINNWIDSSPIRRWSGSGGSERETADEIATVKTAGAPVFLRQASTNTKRQDQLVVSNDLDVFVLDVYCKDLPDVPKHRRRNTNQKHHPASVSTTTTTTTTKNEASRPSFHVLQVHGLFSTFLTRVPRSIELGLFDWRFFQDLKNNGVGGHLSAGDKTRVTMEDSGWTRVDERTGLCTYHGSIFTNMPGADDLAENEFQFRVLGGTPSKEYYSLVLPRNMKEWLEKSRV